MSVDAAAVGIATVSGVAASAAWYAAFGTRLAALDDAYADEAPQPAWVLPVELARSAVAATAVAALADRTDTRGAASGARLGLGLWAAFPVVLLAGSVVHEKVPWQQAAIHAGDWAVKLLLASTVAATRRAARGA